MGLPFFSRPSKTVLWIEAALWYGIIFALSAVPDRSGKLADFETVLGILEFLSRKGAHLMEYSVLMVLVRRAWGSRTRGRFLGAFFLVLILAAADEWHQTFVFGRNGSPFDVFVDSIGGLIGAWVHRHHEKKKPSPQDPQKLES
jgi:VanZ family protein